MKQLIILYLTRKSNACLFRRTLTSLRFPSAVHYLHVRNINIAENGRDELYSARKTP